MAKVVVELRLRSGRTIVTRRAPASTAETLASSTKPGNPDIQILMGSVNVSVRPSLYPYLGCALPCGLTRRQNALGCKPRISRAASHAVTNFMRISDANSAWPSNIGLQHELTEVLTREELEERLGKGRKPGDDESRLPGDSARRG